MSREAFEVWAGTFWSSDIGHLTPNGCLHAAWKAAMQYAYADAAEVCAAAMAQPSDMVPFAWACIAENGNIIIWSADRKIVTETATKYGRPVVELYMREVRE
jgi:hypothetical protein